MVSPATYHASAEVAIVAISPIGVALEGLAGATG